MILSPHFTVAELTATHTGLPNQPDHNETGKLQSLAMFILEPIRRKWGPIKITSGFRCADVNKAVGGSRTSQHRFGEAADCIPLEADIDTVFEWIVKESGLKFGQCINEKKGNSHWIHISLERMGKKNQEALVYAGRKYTPYV